MASTTFSNGTVIQAAWMNDVNDFVYNGGLPDEALTYYVATTGNDTTGTGTALAPFATVQKAVNVIANSPIVAGSWGISIAAGTYNTASNKVTRIGSANMSSSTPNDTAYQENGVVCKNYIYIFGPDVGYDPATDPTPTPTAIFDGGGTATSGFQVDSANVLFKNIKGINYDGSSSTAFIQGERSKIRCENVHGDGNWWDIAGYNGKLEVKGGTLNGAQGGAIRSIFLNKHEIGNQAAGAIGQGPFITNAAVGLYAQEGATGHSDYVSYDGCVRGVRVSVNSRVNLNSSDFKNCTQAVLVENGNILRANVTFNDGTADANGENVVLMHGAVDLTRDDNALGGYATNFLDGEYVIGDTGSITVLSKTLTKGDFAPALTAQRHSPMIKFTSFGARTGTAGTVKHKLRLGSTVLVENTVTSGAGYDGDWKCEGTIAFLDSNSQVANLVTLVHTKEVLVDSDKGTDDLSAADVTLTYEVELSNAADEVRIYNAHFEVWG